MAAIASRLPDAWGLKDEPLPALRRGLLVAAPVGIALVLDLWMDDKLAGAIGTAILISGFVAFDAPARVRVRWHLLTAPFVGLAAALGVLTSQSTGLTIAAMAVVATVSRVPVRGLAATGDRRAHGDPGAADHPGPLPAHGRCRRCAADRHRRIARAGGERRDHLARLRPRPRGVRRRERPPGHDDAAALQPEPAQPVHAPRAAVRGGDGDRGRDLPVRRLSRPRLLGPAHDPVRAQARPGPDHGADRRCGRWARWSA